MKETLISNVISNLVDKIGVKNSNIVREVLVLEMKDIEIKERERQLVVYQDEITNAIKKFIAIKKLQGCTDRTLKAYLSELDLFFGKIIVSGPGQNLSANFLAFSGNSLTTS